MDTGYIKLGVIKRVQGLKGHLIALLEKHIASLDTVATFFIQLGHTLVPYAIEHCTLQNRRAIIKLRAVNDPTTAHQLKGSTFFALQDALPPPVAVQEPLQGLRGYQLVDVAQGKLGPVQRIDTLPLQKLLVVNYQARELLIPYNEVIIQQVDHSQQRIVVHLPPGFIEALC